MHDRSPARDSRPVPPATGLAFLAAAVVGVLAVALLPPGPPPPLACLAVALFAAATLAGVAVQRAGPAWRHGLSPLLSLVPYALLHVSVGSRGADDLPLLSVAWLALFGTRLQVFLAVAALGVQRLLLPVPGDQLVTASDRVLSAMVVVIAAVVASTVHSWSSSREEDTDARRRAGAVLEHVAGVVRDVRAGRGGRAELCAVLRETTDAGSVALFELRDGALVVTAAAGRTGGPVTLPLTPGSSVVADVLREPRRYFVSDQRALPGPTGRRGGFDPVAMLWEPVCHDEAVVAVLRLTWDERLDAVPAPAERAVAVVADELAALLHREALADRALTDELTGLPNRRVWHERAASALTARRSGEQDVVVAMLDLDHFKAYNDRHGHAAGDALLAEFARAATAELRRTDVLIRWGGEEFVALLPGCGVADAVRLLERVRCAVPGGQTCSAGLARWDGEEDATALLARADRALYHSKSRGRDRLTVDDHGRRPRLSISARPA